MQQPSSILQLAHATGLTMFQMHHAMPVAMQVSAQGPVYTPHLPDNTTHLFLAVSACVWPNHYMG